MSERRPEGDFGELNAEARAIWETNATWWDDRIGDGNTFQDELIEPTQERLLGVTSGEVVLDVACGAGRFTRRLAASGAQVVGFDFSERFIARAREKTPPDMTNVEYHVIDATDFDAMLVLGERRFDAAVATMALMDVATLDPLMHALARLLKPGGRFVFSVMHPCFETSRSCHFAESAHENGRHTVRNGVKIIHYRTPRAWKSEGILGQPEAQHYFHRPLEVLFVPMFDAGFVVDALEEPRFQTPAEDRIPLRWKNMPEIPPILVASMRLKTKVDDTRWRTDASSSDWSC